MHSHDAPGPRNLSIHTPHSLFQRSPSSHSCSSLSLRTGILSLSNMESGRKQRKSLFKRKEQKEQATPQAPRTTSQTNQPSATPVLDSPDTQRTKARYIAAAKALDEVVKGHESQWGSFDFPELRGELTDFNNSQFKDKINEVLQARKLQVKLDRTEWRKCTHALECVFTAFSPLAKNILTIAKESQSVSRLLEFSHFR
jgi:hypothetical protein